jgi:hypothetical protein
MHTRAQHINNTHTNEKREHMNQNDRVTAQERAQISLQQVNIMIAKIRSCSVLKGCFGNSSMRLGGPFIAPRDLRTIEASFGRHWFLLSRVRRTLHSANVTGSLIGYFILHVGTDFFP